MPRVEPLDTVHARGGGGFAAPYPPAATGHLDLYYAETTLLDKTWQPWGLGTDCVIDALEMVAISLGTTREALVDTPVFSCVINTNSPLQLDIPMAEGLMALAEHGQAIVITPFTLPGAMSPITLAGARALIEEFDRKRTGVLRLRPELDRPANVCAGRRRSDDIEGARLDPS